MKSLKFLKISIKLLLMILIKKSIKKGISNRIDNNILLFLSAHGLYSCRAC